MESTTTPPQAESRDVKVTILLAGGHQYTSQNLIGIITEPPMFMQPQQQQPADAAS